MAVTTVDSLPRVAEAIYDNDGIALDQPGVINPVTGLYGDTRKLTGAVLMEQISQNSVIKTMVNDNVLQETNRAIEKETELNNAIIAETDRAVQQEENLAGRITNEENRAVEHESELAASINTEKNRAILAEGNLGRLIADEELRASIVEGELRADLTAETAWSQAAEQAIEARVRINQIVNNLTGGGTQVPLSAEMGKNLEARKINYTDIINDLITGGAGVPLSAEMGKLLAARVAEARRSTHARGSVLIALNAPEIPVNYAIEDGFIITEAGSDYVQGDALMIPSLLIDAVFIVNTIDGSGGVNTVSISKRGMFPAQVSGE
jgi:hypothetical protein